MFRIILLAIIPLVCSFRIQDPPPVWKKALMARYIIHKADWASVATISTQDGIKGYPFATVKSMSDGPEQNGTGVPFFYMTTMELSQQDLEKDNRCTISVSLSEVGYCQDKNYDAQDPRCPKAFLTGKMIKVEDPNEYEFGKNALFEKHPQMKKWPSGHGFFVSKLEIEQIELLDFFGGISKVSVEDYFKANADAQTKVNTIFEKINVIDVILA